ncbi:MAG: GDP-L-fucose synthase [Bacteriovoracaceae bacterium]|nr:GDP-L-fucose synthase [Bacteriovoracaceae bacterium]
MKIFITGASGMVGKNLTEHQEISKHQLLTPSHRELDLCDYQAVNNFITNNSPDLIIHCAGIVGGIQANIKNPTKFLVQNLDMGRNVVMAAKENGIKQLINLGSSCMYPRGIETAISEQMVLKGELEPTNEGYAIAKVAVAKLCEYISKEDPSNQYKTLIPCNLYGKYDKFDPDHSHMIPAVIRKIHLAKQNGDKQVTIWGDGKARREFMYVEDLANFIGFAIGKLEQLPPLLNVGLGKDYTINEYYQAIAEVIGYSGEFVHDLEAPVGMKRKMVDTTKLSQFGWQHTYTLKEGLKKTYQYFLG